MPAVHERPDSGSPAVGRLFDRRAIALVAIIFLTEAAIAIIFFSLVQQYPAHLLALAGMSGGPGSHLLRIGAIYAGYALSAYGVAKLPAQPLSGWLADRFGARRLLLLGMGICVLIIPVMWQVSNVTAFVVTCGVYGLAAAVVWPTIFAMVGDYYHASGRGRITAAISGAQVAGSAGGFAGGAVLIDHAGFGSAFALAAGMNLLAFLLGLWRPAVGTSVLSPQPASATEEYDVRGKLHMLRTTLSPDLLLLSAMLVLVSLSVSLLAPDLKPYSANVLHVRFSTLALLLAIPAGAAVLALIPSGIIADRLGRSIPMISSAAIWACSMVAITFSRSIPLVLLFASIGAFAYALGLPAWSASLIDLSTAGRRGLQVGFAAAVQGVGLAIGPAIGGETVARFGALAPFRCSAGLMLVVLALTVAYRARASRLYLKGRRATAPTST
jgi:DHA1 family tetracycline resistance protein-like MFS transporter